MPKQKTKIKSGKSSTKSLKKKVPLADEVKVIKFRCPNCGETDEKVVMCEHCDSPMEVDSTVNKDRNEIEADVTVDKVVSKKLVSNGGDNDSDDETSLADPESDAILDEGLVDIFPGDGSSAGGDTDAEMPSLDEALDILDQE
ncbi:MAG: hypothetical protein U9Q67_00570 [Patescibacteria group bacterium]|nr:hypothetical protein [Patescibacteria group bacterium]